MAADRHARPAGHRHHREQPRRRPAAARSAAGEARSKRRSSIPARAAIGRIRSISSSSLAATGATRLAAAAGVLDEHLVAAVGVDGLDLGVIQVGLEAAQPEQVGVDAASRPAARLPASSGAPAAEGGRGLLVQGVADERPAQPGRRAGVSACRRRGRRFRAIRAADRRAAAASSPSGCRACGAGLRSTSVTGGHLRLVMAGPARRNGGRGGRLSRAAASPAAASRSRASRRAGPGSRRPGGPAARPPAGRTGRLPAPGRPGWRRSHRPGRGLGGRRGGLSGARSRASRSPACSARRSAPPGAPARSPAGRTTSSVTAAGGGHRQRRGARVQAPAVRQRRLLPGGQCMRDGPAVGQGRHAGGGLLGPGRGDDQVRPAGQFPRVPPRQVRLVAVPGRRRQTGQPRVGGQAQPQAQVAAGRVSLDQQPSLAPSMRWPGPARSWWRRARISPTRARSAAPVLTRPRGSSPGRSARPRSRRRPAAWRPGTPATRPPCPRCRPRPRRR